jgi:enoyl-CoA hydratase
MTTGTDKILAETADGVGWLVFNNPARRNAMSLDMWQTLVEILDRFESDPAVRVLVMRGAGGRAFVSGADISQFEDQRKNAEQAEAYERITQQARQRMDAFEKPLIAMIEGFCAGGGVRVALSADIRIAAEDAIFTIPAAKLGLGYNFESVAKLVAVVGPAVAKEMLLSGRRFSAQEALRVGLVNRVAPTGELESTVRQLASEIAANAPLTIRAAKLAIDQAVLDPEQRDMARVEASIRACFESEDYAIGRKAFMAKQAPLFTGH